MHNKRYEIRLAYAASAPYRRSVTHKLIKNQKGQTKACSKEDKYFRLYSAPHLPKEERPPAGLTWDCGQFGELGKRCSGVQLSYLARIQFSFLPRQTVNAILDNGSYLGSVVKIALI